MPEIQWGSLQHLNEAVSFITTFQTLPENACGRKNYYINNLPHMGNGVGKEHKLKHTHTHPFNGTFSGTTRVSRYQKGQTNLDFTKARDSEWQWHQLGRKNYSATVILTHCCKVQNTESVFGNDSTRISQGQLEVSPEVSIDVFG